MMLTQRMKAMIPPIWDELLYIHKSLDKQSQRRELFWRAICFFTHMSALIAYDSYVIVEKDMMFWHFKRDAFFDMVYSEARDNSVSSEATCQKSERDTKEAEARADKVFKELLAEEEEQAARIKVKKQVKQTKKVKRAEQRAKREGKAAAVKDPEACRDDMFQKLLTCPMTGVSMFLMTDLFYLNFVYYVSKPAESIQGPCHPG